MKRKEDRRAVPGGTDSMGPAINSGGYQEINGLVPADSKATQGDRQLENVAAPDHGGATFSPQVLDLRR